MEGNLKRSPTAFEVVECPCRGGGGGEIGCSPRSEPSPSRSSRCASLGAHRPVHKLECSNASNHSAVIPAPPRFALSVIRQLSMATRPASPNCASPSLGFFQLASSPTIQGLDGRPPVVPIARHRIGVSLGQQLLSRTRPASIPRLGFSSASACRWAVARSS